MDDFKWAILYKSGKTRSPLTPLTLTALRVAVGVIMLAHGWSKLGDVAGTAASFASMGIPAPEVSVWLAIGGEILGGAGLLLGLVTPIASLAVFATMTAAIGWVHAGNGLLASNNGFEYPLTLGLVALFFMVRGAGPLSIDALIERRFSELETSRTPPGRTIDTATVAHAPGR